MSPLERLPDDRKYAEPCLDRGHNPPAHLVLKPGRYRYTCPGCGKETVFTVRRPVL